MQTIFNSLNARWIALAVAFAIGIGGIGFGVNGALTGTEQNQQVQVERCEAGNKLKLGLQEYFKEQLTEVETHGVPYYEQYLDGTEAQIRKLRRESIQKLRRDVNVRFAPENCEAVIK